MKLSKKRVLIFLIQMVSAAVLAGLDQLFKRLAFENLSHNAAAEPVEIIKGIIGLQYSTNTGGAWSILSDKPAVLYTISGVLLLLCIGYMLFGNIEGKILNSSIVLIVAGGAGNMVDRLGFGCVEGEVVDYIATLFMDFPIYNFADILIVVGAFLFGGYTVYEIIKEEKQKKKVKKDGNT